MIKITVITPTVRPEGLIQVKNSLDRQTNGEFEWIIISPFDLEVPETYYPTKLLKDPPKEEGDYWTFNKAMNRAIEQAKGELIVSVQDFTGFVPDGLDKFWFYYDGGYSEALITGVGDKFDSNGQKVWVDPRKNSNDASFYECKVNEVEFNYCSVPKKAFYDVGGFDEWLDKYAGMDHISVQERLDTLGYKFYLDQTNESFSQYHDRLPNWEENLALKGAYQTRKMELMRSGEWPKLKYLVENP